MPPLKYHSGQLAIQTEAKTTLVAEQLAHWVGPVAEFAQGADMVLLAAADADSTLHFTVLSGAPPLVEPLEELNGLRLRLPHELTGLSLSSTFYGGLVISLANARRARINGRLVQHDASTELVPTETFTLCKKYIAPTLALDEHPHVGPDSREPMALTDPRITNLLARAETSFFASLSPEGKPDVAHRGGPSGFLQFDAVAERLSWNEYVGDGVFKSAGNLRATNIMTMLVPDLETGDGIELIGHGDYKNLREDRKQRIDPLVQHREDFPVQGVITCEIDRALRLSGLLHPRRRLERAIKITSRSTVSAQAPQ
ncbi:MAG: pyridoxamine 5'-phosphate oxidase family protein [Anaerolineales bacterium]|jgi:hypothetical protein